MTRDEHLEDLKGRVRALEATVERMDADRKIFVVNQRKLGRNLRRVITEKNLLILNNEELRRRVRKELAVRDNLETLCAFQKMKLEGFGGNHVSDENQSV